MAQEAGVDPGITQAEGFAINSHRTVLQRPDDIVGGVHQRVEIGAMVPAEALRGGDEHLQRRVAGASAHSSQRGVDAVAALFHRDDGIGHAEAEVVVRMHAGLGLRIQHRLESAHAVADVVHVHRATGIGHVDALCAVGLHQLALRCQLLSRNHVAHH